MKKDLEHYLNQRHFADIEAKGFYDVVNCERDIWCLCSITEDDEVLLFHDYPEFDNVKVWDNIDKKEYTIPPRVGSLVDGARFWYRIGLKGGTLSIHNLETYDRPVIEKVWPKCKIPDGCLDDTYVRSKVQWFDRPCPKGAKSAHGLQAYAIKFGIKKPPIEDFSTMDAYKLHRVVEDCRIQKKTTLFLDREAEQLKTKFGIDFSDVINNIERPYARVAFEQELRGAKVDVEHIKRCIKWLDEETERLASYIEPNLPMSLKKKGSKVGRAEMSLLLLGKDNVPEEYDDNGEILKRYYKPSINFTNKADKIYYQGFNISYGESPRFSKLKDFRDWLKINHPETKVKDWDYEKKVEEGVVLDGNTCKHFSLSPEDTDIVVGSHTRLTWEQSKLTQHEIVKGYLIRCGISWAEVWNDKKVDGQVVRAEFDMEVRYPPNAHPDHQMVLEIKKGDNMKTSPKFGKKEYEQLGEDAEMGKDIAKYNTYMHRRRLFSNPKDPEERGVLAYVRDDGRVPCGLGNFMTSTGRSNQRVIVNLPSESSLYGKEMREAIIADEGKILIGCDQKSSQLSIAAFIADNKDYYNAVATGVEFKNEEDGSQTYVGTSAHCVNARNFGLVEQDEWRMATETQDSDLIHNIALKRKKSKGPSFGVIFGCSGKKLGLMLDIDAKEGNEKKNNFLTRMGLDKVISYVKRCENQFKYGGGFFIPVYGYWLWCRGANVGVNYFCQGLEAIIQKKAVLAFDKELTIRGWKDHTGIILQVHDEVLIESKPELADEVGKIMCECYTNAGKDMLEWYKNNQWAYPAGTIPSIDVDFSGGYAKGVNYYSCH